VRIDCELKWGDSESVSKWYIKLGFGGSLEELEQVLLFVEQFVDLVVGRSLRDGGLETELVIAVPHEDQSPVSDTKDIASRRGCRRRVLVVTARGPVVGRVALVANSVRSVSSGARGHRGDGGRGLMVVGSRARRVMSDLRVQGSRGSRGG